MALSVCRGCTAKYAVGLARCPQCASQDAYEDGAGDAVRRARRNPPRTPTTSSPDVERTTTE